MLLDVDGRRLLVFHVEPGDNVHTLTNGNCFLRVGDESRRLSPAQHQELIFDRGGRPFEATPVDLSVADLDAEQLASYRQPIGSCSVEEMLFARGLVSRRGELTAAAALLFDARPQREFPSAHVRIMRYGAEQRGTGSQMSLEKDTRVEGSIPHQIMAASLQIEDRPPAWQQLGQRGLFEDQTRIPRDAWLEGLVNAVVHRSYNMMGDHIRVEIFPNRLEITSPGRFPGIVDTFRPLSISRYASNPRIARVYADMGVTRELGEGIKRMFAEMHRTGLLDPIYTQSASSVTLILSAADALAPEVLARLPRSARRLLDELRLAARPLGTGIWQSWPEWHARRPTVRSMRWSPGDWSSGRASPPATPEPPGAWPERHPAPPDPDLLAHDVAADVPVEHQSSRVALQRAASQGSSTCCSGNILWVGGPAASIVARIACAARVGFTSCGGPG